jgi:hypothetical protein
LRHVIGFERKRIMTSSVLPNVHFTALPSPRHGRFASIARPQADARDPQTALKKSMFSGRNDSLETRQQSGRIASM